MNGKRRFYEFFVNLNWKNLTFLFDKKLVEMVKTGSGNGKFWELDLKGLIRAKRKRGKFFLSFLFLHFTFKGTIFPFIGNRNFLYFRCFFLFHTITVKHCPISHYLTI